MPEIATGQMSTKEMPFQLENKLKIIPKNKNTSPTRAIKPKACFTFLETTNLSKVFAKPSKIGARIDKTIAVYREIMLSTGL